MQFEIQYKDGHRETYSTRYNEDIEEEREAAWDEVNAHFKNNKDIDYIDEY